MNFLSAVESPEYLGQWSRMEERIDSEETCEEMAQMSLCDLVLMFFCL